MTWLWLGIGLIVGGFIGVAGTIYARPLAFTEWDVELLRKIGTRMRTNESTSAERKFVMVASHDVFRIADRIEAFIRHSSPREEITRLEQFKGEDRIDLPESAERPVGKITPPHR